MLTGDQAAELLQRCEKIAARPLKQCRGRLKKAKSRAPAVWELIVTEAVAQLSRIELETHSSADPDIKLLFSGWRPIWIEVAYLYPRFWREEKRSRLVQQWIHSEAKRRKIDPVKIHTRFDGDPKNPAGPVMRLPPEQDRKKLLQEPTLKEFFKSISADPYVAHQYSSPSYTFSLSYSPKRCGPYLSSSGVLQEAPKSVEEHALYRVLEKKAKQHDVDGPRVICIGSDSSHAVHKPMGGYQQNPPDKVIKSAFDRYSSLSAVILVSIESNTGFPYEHKLTAISTVFTNHRARVPLTPGEIEQLEGIDFNRWKYTFKLNPWEEKSNEHMKHVVWSKYSCGFGSVHITVSDLYSTEKRTDP